MLDFGRRTVVWFQNFRWEWQEFGKNEVIPKFSGICIMKWMWKWTPGNKFESHTSHWEEKEKKKKEKSMIENSTKILKEEIRSLNFKINFGEDVRMWIESLWIESWITVDWITVNKSKMHKTTVEGQTDNGDIRSDDKVESSESWMAEWPTSDKMCVTSGTNILLTHMSNN